MSTFLQLGLRNSFSLEGLNTQNCTKLVPFTKSVSRMHSPVSSLSSNKSLDKKSLVVEPMERSTSSTSSVSSNVNTYFQSSFKFRQLITIMNRLQETLYAIGSGGQLDLPQIAVIGSQSVGKSSVLESFVGHDIFPRGAGVVTRCPLILQLRQVDYSHGTWAQFAHMAEKITDFSLVSEEIKKETERKTSEKMISFEPILLKIFSPHVLDLTLIDLPGITKVPIGKQPANIENQICDMIIQFIKKPNCIILAVTAATSELANSDALKLARTVDPEGKRTFGVITKVDMMDVGTDAMDILLGKVYHLERVDQLIPLLRFVAVVCRNQQELQDNVPLHKILQKEREFFEKHPAYHILASRCGTTYLAVSLSQMLMSHISKVLPSLRNCVKSAIYETEQELKSLGIDIHDKNCDKGSIVLSIFNLFTKRYEGALNGCLTKKETGVALEGGARLNYIFHNWFGKTLWEFNPLESISLIEIQAAILNATGPKAKIFVPEQAFEFLVRSQIEKLKLPSLQCVEKVYEELQSIIESTELDQVQKYPVLKRKMQTVARDVIIKCLEPTKQMIENIFQMELAYCNTNHPDFVNLSDLLASKAVSCVTNVPSSPNGTSLLKPIIRPRHEVPAKDEDNQTEATPISFRSKIATPIKLPIMPKIVTPSLTLSVREQYEVELVQQLIMSYFNIVRKNIADYVPKAIMYFMVNTSKEMIPKELISQLYNPETFNDLLNEGIKIAENRQTYVARLKGLQTALQVINEINLMDFDS